MVNKNIIKGSVAVVVLAAIVLMGLAVVEGFSKEFRDVTAPANMTEITIGAVNVSTRMGTSQQYPYVQTVTECANASNILTTDNYTFNVADSTVEGGFLTLLDAGESWNGEEVNCTGTYLQNSALQGQADKFSTGLAIFGSFIGVLVLAILGKLILDMFTRKKD